MKVSECMTPDVRLIDPSATIREAAKIMAECDSGAVPVGAGDRLVGMITDRDIAIRAICQGKGPKTKVQDVMSKEVKYCFEDEDVRHVAENMADIQVRRLPVMNRDKRLVGIVALGDIAAKCREAEVVSTLASGVSRPSGMHNQSSATRH